MMSRGLKRILGESSLERKTRWLLGGGVLMLMSLSFGIYAHQTENVAYEQLTQTGRALVKPFIARFHVGPELRRGMDEFTEMTEATWPKNLTGYKYQLIRPDIPKPELQPQSEDFSILTQFKGNSALNELSREHRSERAYDYYRAIRAGTNCVGCHQSAHRMAESLGGSPPQTPLLADPNLREGDLMGVVRVRMSTDALDAALHTNRAILLAFAVGTTILILMGSYAIIRFVIVRPVKHLKNVADLIANGQTNVRSELQSADEFEDLSDAFNRMLRNLVQAQDEKQNLILKLDRKIDELAQRNLELHESNRIKSDFLSTMSHELRTPLNSIIGFSEVLLSDSGLNERQERWASNIMTAGKQLLVLINDILDLSKLESGKMKPRIEPVAPAELGRTVLAMFRPTAEAKSVELILDAPEDLPQLEQDPGKLQQILQNLISNAIKFTPEGGVVTLKIRVLGGMAQWDVIDTGVGIAPEEQELIFDKFRQASHPLTREQGGTGLGLSIVRELARLLGGEVTLKSEVGRGSTFSVSVRQKLQGGWPPEAEPSDGNAARTARSRTLN